MVSVHSSNFYLENQAPNSVIIIAHLYLQCFHYGQNSYAEVLAHKGTIFGGGTMGGLCKAMAILKAGR